MDLTAAQDAALLQLNTISVTTLSAFLALNLGGASTEIRRDRVNAQC